MTHALETRPARPRARWLLVYAVPLVFAVVLLFHPNPPGAPFEAIRDEVDRWLFVHLGQLVLTPLIVLVVWRILDGLDFRAATVSRAATVVWAVFFTAYDSIQGIATGLVIRYADANLAGGEQAGAARAVNYLVNDSSLAGNISAIGLVNNIAWFTVAIGGAVALSKAGAGRVAVIAMLLSTLFVLHTAPAGVGLVALAVAGVLSERLRSAPGGIARSALASP